MTKTAVLIDGNYFLKRARKLWGDVDPESRAAQCHAYALQHIAIPRKKIVECGDRSLYRIFYYDCPPLSKGTFKQPWSAHNTVFSAKNPSNVWMSDFHSILGSKRKVAMRMGELRAANAHYNFKQESLKKLLSGELLVSDLQENDYTLVGLKQSGVDMRIGLDVASLAHQRLVDQIILVAGDTDFIPVAKAARKAGLDFLIDPMGHHLPHDLVLQTDGVEDISIDFDPRNNQLR